MCLFINATTMVLNTNKNKTVIFVDKIYKNCGYYFPGHIAYYNLFLWT